MCGNEHNWGKIFGKTSKIAFFSKKSFFHENLPPKDDVAGNIWWQIYLTLLTPDSEYLIGF